VVINFSIPNFITSTPFKTAAPIGDCKSGENV
jgi:hypothetical protein